MRYVFTVIFTALLSAAIYLLLVSSLVPAPIKAEYWLREMITIKRNIVQQYKGRQKIIIASGSGTLFGIDTKQMTRELQIPVINYGLHAGLSLKSILHESELGAERGDTIILPLEPKFYCIDDPTEWQLRNSMAWDHEQWNRWSVRERLKALIVIKPSIIFELLKSRIQAKLHRKVIRDRVAALDSLRVLAKFASAPKPASFAYSAYNLDQLGNMQATEGAEYLGTARSPYDKIYVCAESRHQLVSFIAKMTREGIRVYFANPPYLLDGKLDKKIMEEVSTHFAKEVSQLAPVLDSPTDTVFPRKFFFNTELHLNAEGRKLRTTRLINAILQNNEFSKYLPRKTLKQTINKTSLRRIYTNENTAWRDFGSQSALSGR